MSWPLTPSQTAGVVTVTEIWAALLTRLSDSQFKLTRYSRQRVTVESQVNSDFGLEFF
jgi:hypothetical protein